MTSRQRILALTVSVLLACATQAGADAPSDCTFTSPLDRNKMKALIDKFGGEEFRNPISVTPTSEAAKYDIAVHYATNRIVGCDAKLRTYNGKVVGDTIRARPGDTLHLRLINALPPVADIKHPQDPAPAGHGHHFSFNVTNLHTHGLHTAPQGPKGSNGKAPYESDNVLVALQPGEQQEYRIHIHDKHPAGTFWYHAHVHGSTAVQLSSGMAGALIIEDGTAANGDLDALPEIKNAKAKEKIFVLQQFGHDATGTLEVINFRRRPTLINGQLVPTIRMQPGEVQRWRFIHAGILENVAIALDGHPLYEVAADGISLGRRVEWPEASDTTPLHSKLVLSPGYRTDVLVKAELPRGETSRRVFLRDLRLSNDMSLQAAAERTLRAGEPDAVARSITIEPADKPEQVLAEIIIEGPPVAMDLPDPSALAAVKPVDLEPITDTMIKPMEAQAVRLEISKQRICDADGLCRPCVTGDPTSECKKTRFLVDGRQFSDSKVRQLKLGSAAEWTLSGFGVPATVGVDKPERHPFHIHVNPFYYERMEPGTGVKNWVWKDTLLVPVPGSEDPQKVRMRYTKFTGTFVLHCHILTHEDQGMMQLVEIVP